MRSGEAWPVEVARLPRVRGRLLDLRPRLGCQKLSHQGSARRAAQIRAQHVHKSSAILTLSFAGKEIARGPAKNPMTPQQATNFWIVVVICSVQTALFLLTNWAMNKKEEGVMEDHNYVQITLLTSAFLIDTCINLTQGVWR